MSIIPSSYKSQLIGLNLTRKDNNPIVELLAKGIAFILKYANKLFDLLKDLFDDGGIIKNFEDDLYSTNAIPGLFTVLIVIFLIIFLLWSSIQSFFKWISGGFIKLPDLPISLDKRYTQFVYSFFHLLVSGYLVFVIFISYFRDLLEKSGLGGENSGVTNEEISKNLDIIEIGKRIIKALYLLWIIAIVLVGSTIAKAFYKMACNGANTNIDSFAKIIDSSVVLTLLVSIILIILLKIIDFFNLVVKFFSGNSCSEPSHGTGAIEVKRSQKILELIFNFDVIYFVLRVITLMYEEFASDNLVFLLGRMGEESPLNNCNPDGDDCDKDNFKETLKNFIIGAVLWIGSIIVLYIQFKIPKNPTNDLDTSIGNNIKELLSNFLEMLDGKTQSDKFKTSFTDLKNNMSTAYTDTRNIGKTKIGDPLYEGVYKPTKDIATAVYKAKPDQRRIAFATETGKLAKTRDTQKLKRKIDKEYEQYAYDKARLDRDEAIKSLVNRVDKDKSLIPGLIESIPINEFETRNKLKQLLKKDEAQTRPSALTTP
jgi:hypothetical protein